MNIWVKIRGLFVIIITAILFSGCLKQQDLSNIPHIDFVSFMRIGTQDTCGAILTLNFKDGDGDIGRLNPTDTMPPYNSQSPYRYDLTMVFLGLAKGDNQFRRYYDPNQKDSFQLGFTIKSLPLPVGANKAITGQILTMIPFPFYPIGLQPAINFTAIRFDVFIYDRNFHKSNVVSTGPIPIF